MEIKKPKSLREIPAETWLDNEISTMIQRVQNDGIIIYSLPSEGFFRLLVDRAFICYNYTFVYVTLRERFNLDDDEINNVVERSMEKIGHTELEALTPFNPDRILNMYGHR